MPLPLPPAGDVEAAVAWVGKRLAGLTRDGPVASPRFRGGQAAADAALAELDITGYARRRNQVLPRERRGASGLSPWIRHGLLPLRRVWDAVADAPAKDRTKYRSELLWQEYARHLYARVGERSREPLRFVPHGAHAADHASAWADDPWPEVMRCMQAMTEELERDGWLVNQSRMWLASQWTVRAGEDWRAGEDRFFSHLLDGSRAANRLGWQWTVGAGTGKEYGFSRWQVERRAPELCAECVLARDCPIASRPGRRSLPRVDDLPATLRHDPDPAATAGPAHADVTGPPEAVWLTAESLGDADPALAASPDVPAVFVFDAPLLRRLRLASKRLVFLVETLADLAARRRVDVEVGDPVELLAGRPLAATFTPVPGWRRRARRLDLVSVHPWPWLVPPHDGSAQSFSAWRRAAEPPSR